MKEILTDEMRQIQLVILQFIDRTCRENNIEYSLGGGSLLGAIRHKGFIPWDDDIDIMLRRDEYERLIDVLSPNNSNSNNINYGIILTEQPISPALNFMIIALF